MTQAQAAEYQREMEVLKQKTLELINEIDVCKEDGDRLKARR